MRIPTIKHIAFSLLALVIISSASISSPKYAQAGFVGALSSAGSITATVYESVVDFVNSLINPSSVSVPNTNSVQGVAQQTATSTVTQQRSVSGVAQNGSGSVSDTKILVSSSTQPQIIVKKIYITRQPVIQKITRNVVVKGISKNDLNATVSGMRSGILGDVQKLITPIQKQQGVTMRTIQQVSLIQDISNLIVHNGDFKGGVFADGVIKNASSVSANDASLKKLTVTSLATSSGSYLAVDPNGNVIATSTPLGTSGTGTVTSIAASGGTTGLTFTGSPITSAGTLTLGGTLSIASGGTGAATLANLIALGTDTTGNYVATIADAGGLTIANSGTESAAATIALNTANPNTWTALQTFANATTTSLSSTYASSTSLYAGTLNLKSLATPAGTFLAVDSSGKVIATSTPSSGASIGTGTTGQIPYYAANGTTLSPSSALTVTSGGSLGVGTTSPWGQLSVEMNTTNPSLVVSNSGSTTPAFYVGGVNQDGGVGVGTTGGAGRRLDVLDVGNPQLRLSQTSSVYTNFQVAPTTGDLTVDLNPNTSATSVYLTQTGGTTGANLRVCEGSSCPAVTMANGGNILAENGFYFGNGYKLDQVAGTTTAIAVYDTTGTAILVFDQY